MFCDCFEFFRGHGDDAVPVLSRGVFQGQKTHVLKVVAGPMRLDVGGQPWPEGCPNDVDGFLLAEQGAEDEHNLGNATDEIEAERGGNGIWKGVYPVEDVIREPCGIEDGLRQVDLRGFRVGFQDER